MKRSRLYLTLPFLLALQIDLASAATLRATQSPAQSPDDAENNDGSYTNNAPTQLTVKLSRSTRHRAKGSQEGAIIPLVGVGVGNSPHHKIPFILASALSSKTNKQTDNNFEDLHYRLVDTSHTDSALEVLVGRSLSRLLSSEGKGKSSPSSGTRDEYHLLIKIHHTHLGYERTMLSIQNSLSDILPGFSSNSGTSSSSSTIDFRVHAVIQYPRCYDSFFMSETYKKSPNFPVKHSSCREEEDALDAATKSVGPSPLIDTENAWRRSWRALEELYHHGTLESIGVSNFGPFDMKSLYEISTEGPHIYQGSLRTLLMEEVMIEELIRHGVHYQCTDAASAVLEGKDSEAYASLERMGAKHGSVDEGDSSDAYGYSAVQVVLGWLVQRGVGVFPGTTSTAHLAENSPMTLASMPKFSPRESLDIETALLTIVKGEGTGSKEIGGITRTEKEDVTPENVELAPNGSQLDGGIVATFFNTLQRNIRIFQVHPETGRQIQLSRGIPPGRSGRLIVESADVLIAYDGHGVAVKKFLVEEDTYGRVDFICE
uniref:NADP-dependent oxidoreductase domain-containing protein n=1 Tax=Skeletonema marinoi TaxID=267567 RepID=A0A7S2VHR2_9STRA|mmetsp:Transcript_9237/g.15700  ORF Transcript_9237/g.15700 Transcript_9237/m.15700 type:complete len:544 (+) Transcript_9237:115-1746(+)|eukprot:scaffold453_cov155-Skeletonema_marinoi.AAC.3